MIEERVYNFEHLSSIYILPVLNYCVYRDVKIIACVPFMFNTISTWRTPSMWCQDHIYLLRKCKNAHATSNPHPSRNQKSLS